MFPRYLSSLVLIIFLIGITTVAPRSHPPEELSSRKVKENGAKPNIEYKLTLELPHGSWRREHTEQHPDPSKGLNIVRSFRQRFDDKGTILFIEYVASANGYIAKVRYGKPQLGIRLSPGLLKTLAK